MSNFIELDPEKIAAALNPPAFRFIAKQCRDGIHWHVAKTRDDINFIVVSEWYDTKADAEESIRKREQFRKAFRTIVEKVQDNAFSYLSWTVPRPEPIKPRRLETIRLLYA